MSRENIVGVEIRVAVFQNMEHGFFDVTVKPSYAENDDWALPGYVRMSDWMNITFTTLDAEAIVGNALISLNKAREAVVNDFAGKLKSIDDRIANIRALAAPV